MSLRAQALHEFELPATPARVDELSSPLSGDEALRVHAPAGVFLLLCSRGALALAFEATLFELLAEARYPAPRPRRTRSGSFVARLKADDGSTSGASCYAWPPGELLAPGDATPPQLLEVGRLCARLHQLAETHPVAVNDPAGGTLLSEALGQGREALVLRKVLAEKLSSLPSGAVHGGLGPARTLFMGDRCSSVMPGGRACTGPLVLDVAEAVVLWGLGTAHAAAALRAIVSGYQALRRLAAEEKDALFTALRYAAAREGARRLSANEPDVLAPLLAADALGEAEARAAAG